jgi:hypothetical protein
LNRKQTIPLEAKILIAASYKLGFGKAFLTAKYIADTRREITKKIHYTLPDFHLNWILLLKAKPFTR